MQSKSQYFEAILQLRNDASESFDVALKFALADLERSGRPDIFSCKQEKVRGGIDIYLSSRKYAKKLGQLLHERFGGILDANPRLFSRDRQTSKTMYRLQVLVRLPDFEPGAVIRSGKKLLLVKHFRKDSILCINLLGHKHQAIDYEGDYEVVLRKPEISKALVTRHKPVLEVLHPENFESTLVENCSQTKKDKLDVIVIEGKLYSVN